MAGENGWVGRCSPCTLRLLFWSLRQTGDRYIYSMTHVYWYKSTDWNIISTINLSETLFLEEFLWKALSCFSPNELHDLIRETFLKVQDEGLSEMWVKGEHLRPRNSMLLTGTPCYRFSKHGKYIVHILESFVSCNQVYGNATKNPNPCNPAPV